MPHARPWKDLIEELEGNASAAGVFHRDSRAKVHQPAVWAAWVEKSILMPVSVEHFNPQAMGLLTVQTLGRMLNDAHLAGVHI